MLPWQAHGGEFVNFIVRLRIVSFFVVFRSGVRYNTHLLLNEEHCKRVGFMMMGNSVRYVYC
jgi:hypothetical protein